MNCEFKINEQLSCDKCGRFGALVIGERTVCEDCYGSGCSCCPELGREEDANKD